MVTGVYMSVWDLVWGQGAACWLKVQGEQQGVDPGLSVSDLSLNKINFYHPSPMYLNLNNHTAAPELRSWGGHDGTVKVKSTPHSSHC